MSETQRISGKDLGALALEDACERCFWVRRHAVDGLPFGIFPSIFSSIDTFSKRVVHGWFDAHGAPPPWLGELGDLVGYIDPPHHSRFRIEDAATAILLTGEADAIFLRRDGSLLIGDYKTARHTKTQDSLFPTYRAQLNAYALIAESLGLGRVSGLSLIYTEPVTDDAAATSDLAHRADGFALGFSAKIVPVDLDATLIPSLLARARRILDLGSPPTGRVDCDDCTKVDGLVALLGSR